MFTKKHELLFVSVSLSLFLSIYFLSFSLSLFLSVWCFIIYFTEQKFTLLHKHKTLITLSEITGDDLAGLQLSYSIFCKALQRIPTSLLML